MKAEDSKIIKSIDSQIEYFEPKVIDDTDLDSFYGSKFRWLKEKRKDEIGRLKELTARVLVTTDDEEEAEFLVSNRFKLSSTEVLKEKIVFILTKAHSPKQREHLAELIKENK